jgi:hypothetical protein
LDIRGSNIGQEDGRILERKKAEYRREGRHTEYWKVKVYSKKSLADFLAIPVQI